MKAAVRLPPSTSNDRLLKLGVHNTIEELTEATIMTKKSCLSNSVAGRTQLYQLNLTLITHSLERVFLSTNLRSQLNDAPIPKNMHPARDGKRRKARAWALQKQYTEDHGGSRMALAVTDSQAKVLMSCSIITTPSTEAEEAAITLARISTSATTIIGGSKSAILN